MKVCPKCNKKHSKQGKYCSRSCANSRTWSKESKRKRGEKLKKYIAENPSWSKNKELKKPQMVKSLKKTLYVKNKQKFLNGEMKDRSSIKKWLIEIKGEICSLCGIGPEWNGEYLSLQVDHINGVYNDNAAENVRLVCPNCHSQTETFSGKYNRARVV